MATTNGESIPTQATSVVRWPDGSVKWALLDFQTDLSANKTKYISLNTVDGKKQSDISKLAKKTNDKIIVNTGKLKLIIPLHLSTNTTLFNIAIDKNRDGSIADNEITSSRKNDMFLRIQSKSPGPPEQENWLRDASDDSGELFYASLDHNRQIAIEENGPLRSAIKLDGWYVSKTGKKAFKYCLRIHAFKNSSQLKFQHTFTATEDVKTNFLREMGFIFPLEGNNSEGILGLPGNGKISRKLSPSDSLSLYEIGDPRLYHLVSYKQKKHVHSYIDFFHNGSWQQLFKGKNAPGWAVMNNNNGGIACAIKDFKELHPKELRVTGNSDLKLYIWPDRGKKVLDLRRRSGKLDKGFIENDMDPNGGRGLAKTHEFAVTYSTTPLTAEYANDLSKAIDEPILPYTTPEYYLSTKACGEFLPGNSGAFPKTEAAIKFGFDYMRKMREAFGLNGMIDWGDVPIGCVGYKDHKGNYKPDAIPFRGYTGWNNSDFALCYGFFLHYYRTGDRDVFKDGEAMTMHVIDIDTEHYNPDNPASIGSGHRHDQQHWGNGFRGYCYAPHAAIDLFLLTGNRRALDVAKEMADNIGSYGRFMPLRLWEITGNKAYLEKAEKALILDLKLAKHPSGWPFRLYTNFRSCSYDNIGLTYYDSIRPNEPLENACIKGIESLRNRYVTPWLDKSYPPYGIFAIAHKYNPSKENTEVLKILVWLLKDKLPENTTTLSLPPNATFKEYEALNKQVLKLIRTDRFSLFFTANLPRALERLRQAGVTEEECLNYKWKWIEPESFEGILDNAAIKQSSPGLLNRAYEWNAYTKHMSPAYRPNKLMPDHIQKKWQMAAARHQLYENGKPLGPHPFPRALMGKNGKLGWTRRLSGALVFSTPDNSDPSKNNRTYKLIYQSEADCKWEDQPSFSEILEPGKIMPYPDISKQTANAWCYITQNSSPRRVPVYPERQTDLQKWQASIQRHTFTENSKKMSFSKSVSPINKGQKSLWTRNQNLIIFSTSDGSDPRKNGRIYKLNYSSEQTQP
jgi:hypothetical protein